MPKPFITEWRRALRGYAFWAMFCSSACFLVPFVAWHAFSMDLDPNIFGMAAMLFSIGGMLGRFIAQPDGVVKNLLWILVLVLLILTGAVNLALAREPSFDGRAGPSVQIRPSDAAPVTAGAAITNAQIVAYALPYIERFEGMRLKAYQDIVGVWTICAGTTRGVYEGMVLSEEQCRAIMSSEAAEYWRGVSAYMTRQTLLFRMTIPRGAGFTSFAINVGTWAAGHSTAVRELNAGNIPRSCEAMTWWNRAGQKIVTALQTRRTIESKLCMMEAAP